MSAVYKAFFRFSTKWWIPIDAIKDRSDSIPNYIRIASPGDVDLYATLEEARRRGRIGLRVAEATIDSIIGREAIDGLNYYHQYERYNPSFPMWFAIEKYMNGRKVDTFRLTEPKASQGSAPSVYASGRFWSQVIDLKLPSAALTRDAPQK